MAAFVWDPAAPGKFCRVCRAHRGGGNMAQQQAHGHASGVAVAKLPQQLHRHARQRALHIARLSLIPSSQRSLWLLPWSNNV